MFPRIVMPSGDISGHERRGTVATGRMEETTRSSSAVDASRVVSPASGARGPVRPVNGDRFRDVGMVEEPLAGKRTRGHNGEVLAGGTGDGGTHELTRQSAAADLGRNFGVDDDQPPRVGSVVEPGREAVLIQHEPVPVSVVEELLTGTHPNEYASSDSSSQRPGLLFALLRAKDNISTGSIAASAGGRRQG
jgi:hypothetical protein